MGRIINYIPQFIINKKYSFCDGVTGLGWLLKFLHSKDLIEMEDELKEMDRGLVNLMSHYLDRGFYDFLHGAGGIIFYFLSNQETALNNDFNLWVQKLISMRKDKQSGIYWEAFDFDNFKLQEGSVDFGLAHGLPSVISILSIYYSKSKKEEVRGQNKNYLSNLAVS